MALPGDAHPEEKADVDQHLVSPLATVPAFAVGTRTTKMEKEEIVTYSFLQMLVTTYMNMPELMSRRMRMGRYSQTNLSTPP